MALGPNKNNLVRSVRTGQLFPDIKNAVSSATIFNQGDLLIFDTVSSLVRAPTAEAECQYFIGCAAEAVSGGKPLVPYNGADLPVSSAIPSIDGPLFGSTFALQLEGGATVTVGAKAYAIPASGGQYVATTGTKAIGIFMGPAITGAAAGTLAEVLIGVRYPDDSLKF